MDYVLASIFAALGALAAYFSYRRIQQFKLSLIAMLRRRELLPLDHSSDQAFLLELQAELARTQSLEAKAADLAGQVERFQIAADRLRNQESVSAEQQAALRREVQNVRQALGEAIQALETSSADLKRSREEVASANRARTDFIANVSHELRTPLNSLMLLSRSLSANSSGNLTEEQAESAQMIHVGGQQLLQLINDILDFSKVEAGKLEVHPYPFDIEELLSVLDRSFRPLARDRGLKFVIERADGVPNRWLTDLGRLRQVLNNLLSNAFKFTAHGSVTLVLEPEATKDGSAPRMRFSVHDTGIGIATADQSRIFHPFEQAEAGTARRYGGTGLGLAICRNLTLLLGGELLVQSQPGKGSTFTCLVPHQLPDSGDDFAATIPVFYSSSLPGRRAVTERIAMESFARTFTSAGTTQASPIRGAISAGADPDGRWAALRDKTVLVVDDDMHTLFALSKALKAVGIKVQIAADGAAADAALARNSEIAAVLLDMVMPGLDGPTLLQQWRAQVDTAMLPVMAVTASTLPGDRERFLALGANDYLAKPIDLDRLLAKLEALITAASARE